MKDDTCILETKNHLIFKNLKMAGIDKTYTDSYKDYKEFRDWADKQFITLFNGYKVCIGDWVRECDEEDFNDGEIPIMNTPNWVDIYLIQNCKSEFVLDRMKSVYNEESYKEFQNIDLTKKPPIEFQQNRKITIKNRKGTRFPLHEKPYSRISRSTKFSVKSKYKPRWWLQCWDDFGKPRWWLQCWDDFGYHEETKVWSSYDSYYPRNTKSAHIRSIKGIVRHLRKQYLPKGIAFIISGVYVGEDYLISVS